MISMLAGAQDWSWELAGRRIGRRSGVGKRIKEESLMSICLFHSHVSLPWKYWPSAHYCPEKLYNCFIPQLFSRVPSRFTASPPFPACAGKASHQVLKCFVRNEQWPIWITQDVWKGLLCSPWLYGHSSKWWITISGFLLKWHCRKGVGRQFKTSYRQHLQRVKPLNCSKDIFTLRGAIATRLVGRCGHSHIQRGVSLRRQHWRYCKGVCSSPRRWALTKIFFSLRTVKQNTTCILLARYNAQSEYHVRA